jgi:diadenosine tetraphosphate (Ap4A) HIT family hydrolase
MYDDQNVFAKILRGEIPCSKVYEDDEVLAFDDIAPIAPVHILVIPKSKYLSFEDFTINAEPSLVASFFKKVSHIAKENDLLVQGYRLVTNKGINGGQLVPHFHVHILGGAKLGAKIA